MDLQKLIKKYENENKSILNRKPDLDMHGDFTPDGIKFSCNNGFIDDLKALAELSRASQANVVLPQVIKSVCLYCEKDGNYGKWYCENKQCVNNDI